MADKLCIMVCRYLEQEARVISESEGFEDVMVMTYPAGCEDMPLDIGRLAGVINSCKNTYNYLHIFESFSASEIPDKLGMVGNCCFHKLEGCFCLLAGKYVLDRYLTEGAHLITPGQIKNWRHYIEASGFDQKTAQEFFGESTTRVLLLDTGVDTGSSDYLKEFAVFVNLPFEIVPVGLDYFRLYLGKHILEWRTNILRRDAANLAKKVADYATSLDLVFGMTKKTTESDIINSISDLFIGVFAAKSIFYLPITDGKAGSLSSQTSGFFDIEETKNRLLGLQEDYAWTKTENGFAIRIKAENEVVGIIEAMEFACPEYKNDYFHLAVMFADVCGLMVTNARRYELLHNEIEKRIQIENELRLKEHELARSNEELEQFVYTVAHDLKAPLVTSMGFIRMIKDFAEKGEYKKAISKLDQVIQANTRMGQLINDLLELSCVGRIAEEKQRLDMNVILKSFQESIRNRLEKEGFNLVLESAYPTIYANESRVLQAFENLMSNAFKYGRSTSGENVVKMGSREDKDEFLFYVTDNGRGIPKEYHEKIFGLFYRLDNDMNGTGVGLSVVRKVMQFHGGRVWVESEPGKGATFWLAFPKKDV